MPHRIMSFYALIADIVNAPHIPSGTYDCIIFTQSLQSDLRGGVFVRLAEKELTSEELAYHDPRYEIVIMVKAFKP